MPLQKYSEALQTQLFNEVGAFFAFSKDQLDEQSKEGVTYVSMGVGLITPKGTENELMARLDSIHKQSIKKHQEECSKKDIIWGSFANYECQITGDFNQVLETLKDYDITKEEIQEQWPLYYQFCIDNDYF